jgi:ankyrin repeat protein
MSKQEELKNAIQANDIQKIKLLLNDSKIDPSFDENDYICFAAENGYSEIIELLLKDKRVNPSTLDNYPIRKASAYGYLDTVKLLLNNSKVDPSDYTSFAIRSAYISEHLEIVDLLWKYKKVKNKLKKDDYELYSILKQNEIKNKVDCF